MYLEPITEVCQLIRPSIL
jgi:hypothetical protein